MNNDNKRQLLVFSNDIVEDLCLVIHAWLKKTKAHVFSHGISLEVKTIGAKIPFVRKYVDVGIEEIKEYVSDHTGLIYDVHKEALNFIALYFRRNDDKFQGILRTYNTAFKTNKFEAFIKKQTTNKVLGILQTLHLSRLNGQIDDQLIMSKSQLNEAVVQYMQDKYKVQYDVKWESSPLRILYLLLYLLWFLFAICKRGFFIDKKKEEFKLSREASQWSALNILRDEFLIDNELFSKEDILYLNFNVKDKERINAFENMQKKQMHVACVPESRMNINRQFLEVLFLFCILPIKAFIVSLFSGNLSIFGTLFLFHRQGFQIEKLMSLYKIKIHISIIDYDDIATTIILNRHGTKNAIYHWSDMASYKTCDYAFIAHNIFFAWGDIHYDYIEQNQFIDAKISIGCINKRDFSSAVANKQNIVDQIGFQDKEAKTVVFFDTSFSDLTFLPESLYIQYMEMLKEFCIANKNLNVVYKAKNMNVLESVSSERVAQIEPIWEELMACKNFYHIDPHKWSMPEVLSFADVCVNMGMNSPATIALICGENALYYDTTENKDHPFANKYSDSIVFDDRIRLFSQINKILNGEFDCSDVISRDELRQFDAFDDDNASDRLFAYLYEMTTEDIEQELPLFNGRVPKG